MSVRVVLTRSASPIATLHSGASGPVGGGGDVADVPATTPRVRAPPVSWNSCPVFGVPWLVTLSRVHVIPDFSLRWNDLGPECGGLWTCPDRREAARRSRFERTHPPCSPIRTPWHRHTGATAIRARTGDGHRERRAGRDDATARLTSSGCGGAGPRSPPSPLWGHAPAVLQTVSRRGTGAVRRSRTQVRCRFAPLAPSRACWSHSLGPCGASALTREATQHHRRRGPGLLYHAGAHQLNLTAPLPGPARRHCKPAWSATLPPK
jgi:hypothetical protein